jgi:chemotaxis protein methyltransferase CheR
MSAVASESLGLPATGLPLLRDIVHQQTGHFFEDARIDVLGERLAPLVVARGFRSFLDLYYLLRYDRAAAAEAWRDVLDALSVQETYFWREIDQIKAVAAHVVPIVAEHYGAVRIWSAPCATGEEPLTIAMVLAEAGWFDRVRIEIHASDGSRQAIEKAKTGRYRARSFRALPEALKHTYFRDDGDAFVPVPELAARITSWNVANLLAPDEICGQVRSPIVFCRNAFIYFSAQAVKRVVDTFAAGMPRPSYLCVGASESLLSVTTEFVLEDVGGAFMYVKRGIHE